MIIYVIVIYNVFPVSVSPCLYERAERKLKEQAQGYISVQSTENWYIIHIYMYMYMYEYKQWARPVL